MAWFRHGLSVTSVLVLSFLSFGGGRAALAAEQAQAAPQAPAAAAVLPAPPGDAFYDPPSPLPAGSPGDIIWDRPATSPVSGASAWQVLYLSTTARGAPTAVSGTVIVPAAAYDGVRPVVAYAAGTQGW